MNWKQEATDKLKQYAARQASVTRLKEQIATLRQDVTAIKAARSDGMAVQGTGAVRRDERLVNALAGIEEMKQALLITTRWLRVMDSALSELSDEERLVLDRFYIHPMKDGRERLRDELCLQEMSSVYRRKDSALHKFTLHLYGITES